jgi:hypothetical protein
LTSTVGLAIIMRECNLRLNKLVMVACLYYLEVYRDLVGIIEGGDEHAKDSYRGCRGASIGVCC